MNKRRPCSSCPCPLPSSKEKKPVLEKGHLGEAATRLVLTQREMKALEQGCRELSRENGANNRFNKLWGFVPIK